MGFQGSAFQNDAFQVADNAGVAVVTGGLPPGATASHAVPTAQAMGPLPVSTATHSVPVGDATNPKPEH